MDQFQKKLQERVLNNSLRELKSSLDLVDFSSNNYLGLERYLHSNKSSKSLINRSGSRLLSGHTAFKEQVENQIAQFHKADAALFFSSGYLANLGVVSTFSNRNNTIVYDALCHASLRDGMVLSRSKTVKFRHNDLEDLELKLAQVPPKTMVLVESLYSMDGDGPDLKRLCDLCEKYQARLIVDEAHSVGLFGSKGEGLVPHLGLENQVFARIITFGKALGFHGAAVIGNRDLIQYMINFCKPFIYTTAPPDSFFNEISQRYHLLDNQPDILREYAKVKSFFNACYVQEGLPIKGGLGGVYTLHVPGNNEVKLLAEKLNKAGYDVRPILSPTVPKGTERLRICLHAYNTQKEIEGFIKELKKHVR